MFGLVALMQSRDMQDPKLMSLETFQIYQEAQDRADTLLNQFLEDFGEDYYERATAAKPMAIATNGDVNWWSFIREFENP